MAKRTEEMILKSGYIRQAEIPRLFGFGARDARKVYAKADSIDKEEMHEDRVFPHMVRISSVYKALAVKAPKTNKSTPISATERGA